MSSLFKRYQSPLHVIEPFLDDDSFVDFSLKNIKKRVLLELQLSDGPFYKVSNKVYSKQDILELFESIEGCDVSAHLLIWKNKDLLKFLENSELSSSFIYEDFKRFFSQNFQFIECELAFATSRFVQACISKYNFIDVCNIIVVFDFSNKELERVSLIKVVNFYKAFVIRTNGIEESRIFVSKKSDFSYLVIPGFVKLLNVLPEEYSELKYQVAIGIVDLAVSQQKIDLPFSCDIMKSAINIDCNYNIKKVLDRRSRKLRQARKRASVHLFWSRVKKIKIKYLVSGIATFTLLLLVLLILVTFYNSSNDASSQTVFQKDNSVELIASFKIEEYREVVYKIFTESLLVDKSTMKTDAVFNFSNAIDRVTIFNVFSKIEIINNTELQCVFILKDGKGLVNQFVNAQDSILVDKVGNVEYFLYFGNDWTNITNIDNYVISKVSNITVGLNGYFLKTTKNTGIYLDSIYQINGGDENNLLKEFNLRIEINKSKKDDLKITNLIVI